MKRYFSAGLLAAFALLGLGCQSASNPWAGEAYKQPSSNTNPPQSTYAPMPSILPSIEANTLDTELLDDGSVDAADLDLNVPKGF